MAGNEFFQIRFAHEVRHQDKDPLRRSGLEIAGDGDDDLRCLGHETGGRLARKADVLLIHRDIERLDRESAGCGCRNFGFPRGIRFSDGWRAREADRFGRFQDNLRAVLVKLHGAGHLHVLSVESFQFPHFKYAGAGDCGEGAAAEIHKTHSGCDDADS